MSSRSQVDPELLPVLDAFGEAGLHSNPVSGNTLAAYRTSLIAPNDDAPEDLSISEISVRCREDGVENRAIVYKPLDVSSPRAAVLYIHGGGYVMGVPDTYRDRCSKLVRELGVIVVSPAYRLAPENPFPAGLNDCYSCLETMVGQADMLGIDASRIAVFGDSAGGGLAAAIAQRSVACGGPAIRFQVLHYPMLDHRTGSETEEADSSVGEFVWTRESNSYAWAAYLNGQDPRTPFAVPALAEDLSGLPACFLSTAALDLFLDEDINYARRLLAAGVPTGMSIYPGAFHGFDQATEASVVQQFEADVLLALRRGLDL